MNEIQFVIMRFYGSNKKSDCIVKYCKVQTEKNGFLSYSPFVKVRDKWIAIYTSATFEEAMISPKTGERKEGQ